MHHLRLVSGLFGPIADALAFADPTEYTLDDNARGLLLAFAAEIEPRMAPGSDLALDGWGSKLCGFIARVALVLHLVEHGPEHETINAATVANAITIGRWSAVHAAIAFGTMRTTERETDARRILDDAEHLTEGGNITPRNVQRLVQSIDTADRAAAALDLLVDLGWLVRRQDHRTDQRLYIPRPDLTKKRDSRDSSPPTVTTVTPTPDRQSDQSDPTVTTVTLFRGTQKNTTPVPENDNEPPFDPDDPLGLNTPSLFSEDF